MMIGNKDFIPTQACDVAGRLLIGQESNSIFFPPITAKYAGMGGALEQLLVADL